MTKNAFTSIIVLKSYSVGAYAYDAWGNCTVTLDTNGIAAKNPIRYRGYYYDADTNLYYLNARYYCPEWRRFISPDDTEYLNSETANGLNLYTYCNNDPINYIDPSGHFGIGALIGLTVASMLIGATTQLVSNAMSGKTGSELSRGVVGAAVGAGVNTLSLCLTVSTGGASLFIAAGASAIAQTGVDILETFIRGEEEVNVGQTFVDLALNLGTALVGNYLGSEMIPTNPGWFQPQKFLSVFTKSYGQKILLQTAIGAGISGVVNFIRKYDLNKFGTIPASVIP